MAAKQTRLTIETRGAGLYEFTDSAVRFVREAGVDIGLLTLFVHHTSCSLLIQENADPSVRLVTVLAILSITTTAVYVLQATNRMLNGPLNTHFAELPGATWPERITLVLLLGCLFGMGIFPGWISAFLDTSLAPIFANIAR